MALSKVQKEHLSAMLHHKRQADNLSRAMDVIDRSAVNKLRNQKLQQIECDKQKQQQILSDEQKRRQRQYELAEEERVAQELYQKQCERIKDEKLRQQIRENNQELRELEMKLRAAYVGKANKVQLAEREVDRLKEKLEQQNEQERYAQMRMDDEAKQRAARDEENNRKLALRQVLQNQMVDKQVMNQRLYEEFLSEKKLIDEIVKKILDEQMEDARMKLSKRNQYRNDLEQLRRTQEIFRQKNRREIEEENERITEYLKEREQREQNIRVIELEKRQRDDELRHRMCSALNEIEISAREREQLLINLKFEEIQEQQNHRDREELEQKIRIHMQTRFELDKQKEENLLRKLQEDDDLKQYRIDEMRRLAEQDKLEILTNEKKRQKLVEHNRYVRELIAERKRARDAEYLAIKLAHEADSSVEQRRQEIIEEERIKILKDHAVNLIGFLPSGILRESDKDYFNIHNEIKH